MNHDFITITADEVNCLIYSYFQDAGFNHAAFALRNESRLHASPYFHKHIPRGELIELLSKALLYTEVESHWKGDHLATHCKTGFSLLEHHVCSQQSPATPLESERIEVNGASSGKGLDGERRDMSSLPMHERVLQTQAQRLASFTEVASKRATSPVPLEPPSAKRPKRDSEKDEVVEEPPRSPSPHAMDIVEEEAPKPQTKPPGPGDEKTDPRCMQLLPGHKSEVFVCAFNPKKLNLLATGAKDATVNLWDLPSPPSLGSDRYAEIAGPPLSMDSHVHSGQRDLTALSWNKEGTLLAVGAYDGILRIYDPQGSLVFGNHDHEGPVFGVRFSPFGKWLLSCSLDGTTYLWDMDAKVVHRQYRPARDCCLDIEWIKDDTFAVAVADGRIFLYTIHRDTPVKVFSGHKDEVNQIRVNPSRTRLASCSDDGTVTIWKLDSLDSGDSIPGLASLDYVAIFKGHEHSINTVTWCPDQIPGAHEIVITTSFDRTARIWDAATGDCLHKYEDHMRPIYAVAISPDGKFLATGGGDGWLHIYHIRTYERIWSWFAGSERPGIFELDWQSNGADINRIALALESRKVGVLDLNKVEAFTLLSKQ